MRREPTGPCARAAGASPSVRARAALGALRQLRLREQREERLRLEQGAPVASLGERKLGEDRCRARVALLGRLAPLALEPVAPLEVAVVGVEDLAYVQLRRDGPVPLVRLEPEGDVVAPHPAEAVEPAPEAERDRAAGVAAVLADAEAQVLALADRGEIGQHTPAQEQRHVRVAEAEPREPRELGAEVERELGAVREGIDRRDRAEVAFAETRVGDGGE